MRNVFCFLSNMQNQSNQILADERDRQSFDFYFISSKYMATKRDSFIFGKNKEIAWAETAGGRTKIVTQTDFVTFHFMEMRFHFEQLPIILWLLAQFDSEMYPRLFKL